MDKYEQWKKMYESIGYKLILASIMEQTGIDEINSLLQNKVTLLSGHSGVGKSSFINCNFHRHAIEDAGCEWLERQGYAHYYFCRDVRFETGVDKLSIRRVYANSGLRYFKTELSHYFPEMRNRLQDCQFHNCQHIHEPGCAIKKALEEGEIYGDRYVSYLNILDSIDDKAY